MKFYPRLINTKSVIVSLLTGAYALCQPMASHAQAPAANNVNIIQSTFYDAQALYYAFKGYNAYPVLAIGKAQVITINATPASTPQSGTGAPARNNTGPSSTGGGPTQAQPKKTVTIQHYQVVELTTGKILLDDCSQLQLDSVLKSHAFGSSNERLSFISSILARNAHSSDTAFNTLSKLYQDNVYIKWIFSNNKSGIESLVSSGNQSLNAAPAESGGSSVITGGNGLPSLNVLAQGLANFYIARVNDEVDETFFVNLQKALDKYKELGILFPNTLASLDKIQVTSYKQSFDLLKSSFQTDLKNLLGNIGSLPSLPRYQSLIEKYPQLTLLFTACDVISMTHNGKTVPEILYAINNREYIQKVTANDFNATVKLAAGISSAFLDVKIGDPANTKLNWVKTQQLAVLKNDTVFRFFTGLFAQSLSGTKIGSFDFGQSLIKYSQQVIQGKYIIYNFPVAFNAMSVQIDSANSAKSTSARAGYYLNIASQALDLGNQALNMLPSEQTTAARAGITKIKSTYLPLLYRADTVVYHVENKEYSAAVYAADTLINQVINIVKANSKTAITTQTAAMNASGNNKDAISAQIKSLEADTVYLHDMQNYYVKYGGFIAAVTAAQTPDDVSAAIQAFALPTGSSRIKKQHDFSWGINSYVGGYYSWNTNHVKNNMPANEGGITAPIGIAANWGHFAGGSLSAYGGILDIGAIFSYTASTNNTVQSQIKLGQILSPSLGLVYGFPIINKINLPLSFGVNYQWGPELKNVDDNGNSILSRFTGRVNIFLAIDIPMFNFSVSKK